jgi:hypothetical protein
MKEQRPVRVNVDQEAVIREFIIGVEEWEVPINPPTMAHLLDLLGYKVAPNGARVWKSTEIKVKFGQPFDVEDMFYKDWQEITDAEIEDTPEPSSGESS